MVSLVAFSRSRSCLCSRAPCHTQAPLLLLSLLLVTPGYAHITSDDQHTVITTATGKVEGIVTVDGVKVFRGIPYAEPPVGDLRWKDPVPKSPWEGTKQALVDGAGCPQQCKLPRIICPPVQSEDCLFLNVFAPAASSYSSGKAVLFWIHGGDFYQGYAGGILYDGHVMARDQDVVVVALNYRLGALGFLYSGPDKHTQFTGNFGLRDQQLAMRWVQDNIAAFGGDPKQVTIFGQSAGGASVASHLNMPSSKGLFARAILQSNPVGLPFRTADKYPKFSRFVAKGAGCTKLPYEACMRNLTWQKVLSAAVTAETNLLIERGNFLSLFQPYSPTVGTPELAVQPMVGFLNGTSMDVPTMMGSVSQEGLIFVYEAFAKKATSRMLEDGLLSIIYGVDHVGAILNQYPRNASVHDMRNHTAPIVTDSLFHCPIRHISLSMANHSRQNFMYHFEHSLSFDAKFWDPSAPICVGNVCHGEELALLFEPNLAQINASYSTEEDRLATSMQSYWAHFAKFGVPGSGSPGQDPLLWGRMEAVNETSMLLQTPQNMITLGNYSGKCKLWDSIGYEWLLRHG